MPPPGYGKEAQATSLAIRYILRVFGAFAHQACELGLARVWTATRVDDASREFLRHLTIDVRVEFGELPIRKMITDMGYITSEVWQEFTSSLAWKKYQEELLTVAELQAQALAYPSEIVRLDVDPVVEKTTVERRAEIRTSFVMPLLKLKGLTRSKWASKAGVDPSVVYDYLSGKSNPRPNNRNDMAEALGVEESQLPD
jgi:hypothetical protein